MPQTEITLAFGDGEYLFRLGLAQIAEIQTKTGTGIGALYARLLKGRYVLGDGRSVGNAAEAEFYLADIIEVLRQGLIGGAVGVVDGAAVTVTPIMAQRLVATYGPPARPVAEAWTVAVAVTSALIEGYEPPKAPPAPGAGATPTKAASRSRKRL
ncbi:gene transfer agent family protein [Sandarakinorhabdus sp. DWP1-3-1]|uniref:gene transfer agent family protein n=1 Tax=Sandarakinorhabdus sp. DWP1-3-1 TaxID=2804627 RepID=UPI003CF328EA